MYVKLLILAICGASFCSGAPSDIIRPCHLKDLKCIRDNLAANSKCDPNVPEAFPNRYLVPKWRFDAPYFNSTYIEDNLYVTNIDKCYVSEFFFNMKTDVSVLALDCPQLGFESTRTLVQHASLKEDTTYKYFYQGTYPMVRLTTNLKHADVMDMCTSYSFADVVALPYFNINPNDNRSADFLTKDLTLLNIYEIETFYHRGRFIARDYVNNFLCNFHCHYEYTDETF